VRRGVTSRESAGDNQMTTSNATHEIPIRRRKLTAPRLGGHLVARPRLMERLDQSLGVPLTLVVGPAGFGKTTAVAQWLDGVTTPSAWLTLDEGDANPRRFVTHLVAALAGVLSLDPDHPLRLLHAPRAIPMADIGDTLADDLFDTIDDVVVVVDNAHMLASPGAMSFLSHFLALMPPAMHLVLISRTDPALPLARFRAQAQVNDLRAAELRFTDAETASLIALLAPHAATPTLVDLLQVQTEGWVTGLRLAAQALTPLRDPAQFMQAAPGRGQIMQFLVEEALAGESAEDQEFLLRLSIPERVAVPLASALTGSAVQEAQRYLDRLMQANLFLEPMADDEDWFQFHPLFRQLLRHQLALRYPPETIAGLHRRAGQWFSARGLIDDAVEQFLLAEDHVAAATLIEEHVSSILAREDWQAVAGWLRKLPEDLINSQPRLLLARGWVAHLSGRAAPLRGILAALHALVQGAGEWPFADALESEADILSLATLLPIEQGPDAALETIERALLHVPEDHRFALGLAHGYKGMALQALGQERKALQYLNELAARQAEQIDAGTIRALLGLIFIHRQAANLRECSEVARQTLTLTERNGLAVTAGWAHLFLGWIAYEEDALDPAMAHFSAIVSDHVRTHLSCVREAIFGMALVSHAQGESEAADAVLQHLTDIIIGASALEHLPVVHGFAARLALLRTDVDRAAHWLETANVTIDSNTLHAFEHALLTRARTLLALGSPTHLADAAADLERLRTRAEATHHRARLVEIWALLALVRQAQGDHDAAMQAITRSLTLTRGSTFLGTYRDVGPALQPLLWRAASDGISPSWLTPLIGPPGNVMTAAAAPDMRALSLLTMRECDVLERLGRRLSYQEIADELFISPGTVKRHAGSIYSKLGVSNRREALMRAQALGWRLGALPESPGGQRS
jgi:LuxR family maltose regulon positive regulatory protein